MIIDGFMMTKKKFTKIIESIVRRKSVTYIDAVLLFCEENKVDEEDIKKYISEGIKSKIEVEAMELNFLPRGNSLPID